MKKKAYCPDSVLARAEKGWVSRRIVDEVVVMPLRSAEDETSHFIYSFSNSTAVFFWEMLDGKSTAGEIIRACRERFAGKSETIEADMGEVIADLLNAGLVVIAGERKSRLLQRGIPDKARRLKYVAPEIAAIKMQPEQAVLSCCSATIEVKIDFIYGENWNCCNNILPDGCSGNCSALDIRSFAALST